MHGFLSSPLRRSKPRATWVCLALSLAAHGSLLAQEADPLEMDPLEEPLPEMEEAPLDLSRATTLAPVTVIGSEEAVQDLAGSGAYIGRETIEQQSYTNVNRLLSRVPGVYLREEDGYGNFPNISLRGADSARSSKVTVMEDGIITAPAPYSAPAAYYSPRMARMSAVEILKGSSQIQYGPHTTGGVINFLSTPIPDLASGYAKMTYGSDNTFFGHLWYGDTAETSAGRIGWLLELHGHRSDGFREIQGSRSSHTGFELIEPMLKLSWEPNGGRQQLFEFKIGYTSFEADETYLGLTERDARKNPHRRYAATRFDNFDSYQFRTYLKHTIQATDNIKFDTALYYNRFERDWFKLDALTSADGVRYSQSTALFDPLGLAILRGEAAGTLSIRHNDRSYYMVGGQTKMNIGFDTGSLTHSLDLGVRVHYDNSSRDQYDEFYEQDDSGRITGKSRGAPGSAGDREEEALATALYLEDDIQYGNFSFKPGIRYEHIEYKYKDFQSGDSGEDSLDVFAPGIGFTYEPTDALTFFGGAYRGISVPEPRAYVRSDIKEETSQSYEIGMRWNDPDRAFAFEIAGFYTNFEDLLVINNVGGTGTGATENVGDIDVWGLEFAASWDPASARGMDFRLPLYLTTTLTRAELKSNASSTDAESIFSGGEKGNEVPYIPEWQLAAGVGFHMDRWGVNLDASYTPAVFTSASNVDHPTNDARFGRTSSAFLVDLSAYYDVTEDVRFLGGIKNLIDDDYITSRLPHGPRTGAPRTWFAGVQYQF